MNDKKINQVERFSLLHEILNASTHGIGIVLSIIGTYFLYQKSFSLGISSNHVIAALIIYCITLNLFLLSSTLFHALIFTRAAKYLQKLDHTAIFLIILGTYTAFIWIFINNKNGWILWWVILGLTVIGILYDLLATKQRRWFLTSIYLLIGWIVVIILPDLIDSLPKISTWLLIAGGITYSLGTIFYIAKKIPLNHVWWHILVLIGTFLIYLSIYTAL